MSRLQRMGDGILADGRVHPEVTAQISAQRGRGAPLAPELQDTMSQSFDHSFADVRVHSDSLADSLARSVSARAFTTGSDIFFASGQYNPASTSGRELIAHELTHVVQQRGAPTAGTLRVSEPGDALEREAERASRSAG